MRKYSSLMAMAALFWAAALPADPAPKAPTDKWIVDFDDAQCVAMRNYGTKEQPLYLVLKQPALGNVMQLSIVRHGRGEALAEQLDGSIALNGGKPIALTLIFAGAKETGNTFFRTNIAQPIFGEVARASTLRVRAGKSFDESFQLDQVGQVQKVMQQCVQDLRNVWNVMDGDAVSPNLAKPAGGTLQGVIKSEDYPGVSQDNNEVGAVTFALLIDEKGKVADCTVIETSGVAALDAQSCGTVKARAHFTPAIGRDGKPAKTAMTAVIKWELE